MNGLIAVHFKWVANPMMLANMRTDEAKRRMDTSHEQPCFKLPYIVESGGWASISLDARFLLYEPVDICF